MKSFLEEVVEAVCQEDRPYEDYIFVLPSKRAGIFIKTYLAKFLGRTLFSPKVYSVEEFVKEVAGLSYASRLELILELYKAYKICTPAEPDTYEEFTNWGTTLLQDFTEIDRYLIPPEKVFSYLSSIQEVNHWSLSENKTQMIQNHLAFWKSLQSIYEQFNWQLLERKIGHQGLVYKKACERIPEYLTQTKGKKHILVGFNALNTAEENLFQEILTTSDADIYWDSDPCFIEDPIHDAGYFIRRHKAQWPYFKTHPLKGLQENWLNTKQINITGVPKHVSQAKVVGDLINTLQEANPHALDKAALVLGDEQLLNPLLNSLPEDLSEVNITMGYPLHKTQAAGLLLQWIDLFLSKDQNGWFFRPLMQFLSHPYIQMVLTTPSGVNESQEIQHEMTRRNMVYVTLDDLLGLELHNNSVVEILFAEKKTSEVFLDHALQFMKLLEGNYSDSFDATAANTIFRINELLGELSRTLQQYPFINDLKALKRLYKELLSSESIDFVGNPSGGLQIMGMLESRNLDFETVIITSVNEGILPSGKSVNSFIPYDVKRELNLPTYKEKDAVYTYHFYRLLQRAKSIHLFYNTEPDVLEGGEKSRLIQQLLTDQQIRHYVKESVASPTASPVRIQATVIPKDPILLQRIQDFAAQGFSPTALSDYIRNPFAFYKKNLLQIRDPEEIEETMEARTFGIIIHNSLEALYQPYIGKILTPDLLKNLIPKITSLVEAEFIKLFPASPKAQGKNLIALQVIIKYLNEFLAKEIEDATNHEIKIVALEERIKITMDVPDIPFKVCMKGTIDRIDEFDGNLRIIDYKTGQVTPSKLNVSNWEELIADPAFDKAFQVLCYCFLYEKRYNQFPKEAGIISFKSLGNWLINFTSSSESSPRQKDKTISKEVIGLFTEQLTKLMAEICSPKLPFVEKNE